MQYVIYGGALLVVMWRVYGMLGWMGPLIVLIGGALASVCSLWWSGRKDSERA